MSIGKRESLVREQHAPECASRVRRGIVLGGCVPEWNYVLARGPEVMWQRQLRIVVREARRRQIRATRLRRRSRDQE